MSKGLEALERVKKAHYVASIVMQLPHEDTETIEAINIIEKELKAFEVIKVKKVQVATLLLSNTCVGYNSARGLLGEDLTQEEYDLLKEVLK